MLFPKDLWGKTGDGEPKTGDRGRETEVHVHVKRALPSPVSRLRSSVSILPSLT